jgi:PRTRC genetic system protein B
MDTSLNIGRSQDFRLCRALLVYGKSDYNGFPYRHPFVVVHDVVHDGDSARLAEGQLLTPDALRHIMGALGQAVPIEILPERVLVRTADTLVWWMPASIRVMFFSDRGGDTTLSAMNGKQYPHPALVFKVSGSHLSVRALTENKRPHAKTVMHMAPYWNCGESGVVCTGSMKIPREKSVLAIDGWETAFFRSEFTHANGTRTKHPKGLVALWKSLQDKDTFPARYLQPVEQTLSDFVSPNDRQTDVD